MDDLHSKIDRFSMRFVYDQQNQQNKQKLGKMKKRKKRKSSKNQVEGREIIVDDNQQQLFKHEMMKSQNLSLIKTTNKISSSRNSNYNCYTTTTTTTNTINWSKCKSSNLRKNRSIAAIALFLVKIFISINILSLDVDNVTQATSQINSVWLSKDEISLPYNDHSPMFISASSVRNNQEDKQLDSLDNGQIKQQHRTSAIQDVSSKISATPTSTNLQPSGSERRADWSSSIAGTKETNTIAKTSSPPSLHTSSSSLQPAIVAMDQADDSDRSNSIKRSDSDSTILSYVRSFNNSDDSTNLDQLWNNRNHTATTNSQVQFDEGGEQQQNYLNRGSNLNQPFLRTIRHQDNETSTLFPQYDSPVTLSPPPAPSPHAQHNDNANQFNIKTHTTNSSHLPHESITDEYLSTATFNNKSDKKQDSDSYFVHDNSAGLDNGDLIASPEPPHIVDFEISRQQQQQQQSVRGNNGNQARRRLHNSGTQYDFRERERATTASLPSSLSSSSGVSRSPNLHAANFNFKQTGFNDGEMLAYNGGDEDDENRLKSVAYKHDNNLNSNNIDNLIQFNNRLPATSQPPYDTFETTSDRFHHQHNPSSKSNIYQPTTPLPYHTSQSHPYLSPQTPVYPISKYSSKNNQISNVPKSRYIIQVPTTVPQRIVTRNHPTPVASIITGSGISQDGVTRQDGSIWNQFATKQSEHRDKIQRQQQLLVRGHIPMLNYVTSPVVPSVVPNRQLGQTSVENNINSETTTTTQKPTKKSLLAALSNRFNNWVDASRGAGNSLAQNSLENSFYNTNQQQVRRMRPTHHHISSPLSAANYYHLDGIDGGNSNGGNFFGDVNSMQSASVRQPIQHSAIALLTAADHNQHHPSVIRSPVAYYPQSYRYVNNKGNYLNYPSLLSIQQPTVSPAPSQIERFYGSSHYSPKRQRIYHNPDHSASYRHQYYNQAHGRLVNKPILGSEPSPASFIPVVAVSVTKTSPAPMSSALLNDEISSSDNQQQNVPRQRQQQQQQQEQHNSASEIDDYLDMRLGNINRDRRSGGNDGNVNRPYKSENEYGNYASSSIKSGNNHNQFLRTARPAAPVHEHTTTVKSAVFGYLPQQIAENPLLKAVNILPQFAPRVSYSSGHHQSAHHYVPSASDAYVNHGEQEIPGLSMNESPQIQDHHHHHRDELTSMPVDEPTPSLALQLQANSFVQNDIAHPFLDHQSSSRKNHYLLSSNFDHQAAGTYGGHSAHQITPIDVYPASQHHLHGFQLFKPGGVNSYHLNQGGNFLTNPLLAESSSLVKSPHLLATSSELNPLMQSIMLANPTNVKFQLNHPEHHQNGQHDDQTASSSSSVSSTSNANDNMQDSDDVQKLHSSSSLNKGNKKRSSEFFANAGQLLLSALPLLLAPTLGLMFASTPNSVARYQGSNPFAANSNGVNSPNQPPGIGTIQHSLPSTYINSLNTGSVSNPSPAPVVFTPTPPGYLMTTMTTSSNRPNKSTKSPQHTTLAPNSAQNSTNGKARSTTPKVIVTVTTSNPPLQSSDTTSNNRNESENALNGKHDHHEHSQVPHDYDASSSSSSSNLKTTPTTILQDTINSSITMTTTSGQRDKTHYDIGYEGVDFDAQFASLRKPTWLQQQQDSINKLQPLNNDTASSYLNQGTLNLQKPIRVDKNRYQYSEVMPQPTRNKSQLYFNQMDEVSSKLYPVSTWPTMRRKTVSLVTSNGNKTLLDSSDKYPDLNPFKPIQNVSNIEPLLPPHNNNNNNNNSNSNNSHHHHQLKPQKVQTNKQKFTTPSYDDEDVDDLEDTNLDNMMEPLNKINTTINILTKKLNPNLLNYEQGNNGSNYDISSLFDLASEQTSSSGHSKIVSRRKRDIERIEKSDLQQQSVGNDNNNKTSTSNRTKYKKKVRKIKIKQARTNSDAILKLPADYNTTTALGNNTSNQTMTTLESRNNNSINEILSGRSMKGGSKPSTSDSSDNQQVDQLKGDASKSKSAHIITTMITHLADDEDDAHGMPANNGGRDDYNTEGGDFGASRDASELREQLIREKILLDKIASSSHNSKFPLNSQQQQQQQQQLPYDEQNNSISDGPENGFNNSISNDWLPTSHEWKQQRNQNFSFGGRGRFLPSSINKSSSAPIEVIATKIKLYPDNVTDSTSGYSEQRDGFGRKKAGLILNDDTKKALANFGSLLIKDTLKIPKPISSPSDDYNNYNRQTGRKSDSARTKRRSFNGLDNNNNRITKTNQRDNDAYGAFETSSTEPNLVQTTSFPADTSLHSKENSEPFHSQTLNDDYYSTGNWQKDQNFYPTNNNLRETSTRYTQNTNNPRRLNTSRSEEEYERAALNENLRQNNQKYDINNIDHHNYRNHNNGPAAAAAYDPPNLDNHVRTMRDRVSLVENDLPNYAPASADDRSSENSYSGSNIPSSYPNNDELPMKFRQSANNQPNQQQYQRGINSQTFRSDPTAPINSYSLYTMHHINRSSSGSNNVNSEHQPDSQPPQPVHLTQFGPSSGFYAPGNHSSLSSVSDKLRNHHLDHASGGGYNISGDISHVYSHSNGHYGPNRRDPAHQHQHQHRAPNYQSNYELRNHGYQQDQMAQSNPMTGSMGSYQQESNDQNGYQYTTYAPNLSHHQPMQPIYNNHKPSSSHQYEQRYHGEFSPTQTKSSNQNDHLPPIPDSTPYSHQQHLPKFYQPSSEIRYPASSTNRNQEMGGYGNVGRPTDSSSSGNIYYSPQHQHHPHPNHAHSQDQARMYTRSNHYQPFDSAQHYSSSASSIPSGLGAPIAAMAVNDKGDSRVMNEYFKRVQFSDSDRDKLMASYLTCDGLLNDNDHCLERLSCEFSDKQNIEKANKLDRAVSSILLGHILINTYIPNQFKLRLKNASLFGHTQSGRCAKYVCNKLSNKSN